MNYYSRKSIEDVLNHLSEYAEELLTNDRNAIYAHQFIDQYNYVKHKYLKEGVDELLSKEEQRQIEQLKGQNQACYYGNNYSPTNPKHYNQTNHDLFDCCEYGLVPNEEYLGFLKLNIFKYINRYNDKNGVEDLKKAQIYLDRLIKFNEYLENPKSNE